MGLYDEGGWRVSGRVRRRRTEPVARQGSTPFCFQLTVSLAYTMAEGRGALPPPPSASNPSPRTGEAPAGLKKASFPPKTPLPVNPSPYGALPAKVPPKLPATAPPKALPPQPLSNSTVPSTTTPTFTPGLKKTAIRPMVPPIGGPPPMPAVDASTKLPSPRDGALPRPLPPVGGVKAATLPPQLSDGSVQLPPPLPSQIWPEPSRSSPRLGVEESDSTEEIAPLMPGLPPVKKVR